jgi:hypothetical protein
MPAPQALDELERPGIRQELVEQGVRLISVVR